MARVALWPDPADELSVRRRRIAAPWWFLIGGFFPVRRNCCRHCRKIFLRKARHQAREGECAPRPGTLAGQIRPPRLAPAPVMQFMKHRAVAVLFECLVLAALLPARADQTDVLIKAEMERRHIPGLSLAVSRAGKLIKAQGYGLANLELAVPVRPDTVFEIGSGTKQITAPLGFMLIEEGKLGLDEKISPYLGELPAAWSNITLPHLLTHTTVLQH